jgi:predicted nuclease of predicted toxin-antitoxin system
MNFLIDAQLPRRVAGFLRREGHDALHTLDLPDANRTTDTLIIDVAFEQDRVVVTKDADFIDSFNLYGRPRKLLLISTGNIANHDLEQILHANLAIILSALEQADFVEVSRTDVIVHA